MTNWSSSTSEHSSCYYRLIVALNNYHYCPLLSLKISVHRYAFQTADCWNSQTQDCFFADETVCTADFITEPWGRWTAWWWFYVITNGTKINPFADLQQDQALSCDEQGQASETKGPSTVPTSPTESSPSTIPDLVQPEAAPTEASFLDFYFSKFSVNWMKVYLIELSFLFRHWERRLKWYNTAVFPAPAVERRKRSIIIQKVALLCWWNHNQSWCLWTVTHLTWGTYRTADGVLLIYSQLQ